MLALCTSYEKSSFPRRRGDVICNGATKVCQNNKFCSFKTAISILVISNRNSFRVLFELLLLPYILFEECICISIVNGQPSEPAVCHLYRHTFVPWGRWLWDYSDYSGSKVIMRLFWTIPMWNNQGYLLGRLINFTAVLNRLSIGKRVSK